MSEFTRYSDPNVPLTAEAATAADNYTAVGALYATHRRTQKLEAGAVEASEAFDNLVYATNGQSVAYNLIDLSTNPTAFDALEIGADNYEFLEAAGEVDDADSVGVLIGGSAGATLDNLVAAINGTAADSGLTKDGGLPARVHGTESVRAVTDGSYLVVYPASSRGGSVVAGEFPSLEFDANLDSSEAWTFTNFSDTAPSGIVPTVDASSRIVVDVTTARINANSLDIMLPFSAEEAVVKFTCVTSAGAVKSVGDTVVFDANSDFPTSLITVTFGGTGGDAANGDKLLIEVWAH